MSDSSIFDVLGPVMIGPSSSHTAGAVRIGNAAKMICGAEFDAVTFYLHGSFAKTYRGHGSDRALVGGILGMNTEDERIRSSYAIAEDCGIKLTFVETDLGDVHPNTVKIIFSKKEGGTVSVTASSMGGGEINIIDIDGERVDIDCKYPTAVLQYQDQPGMISLISGVIATYRVNIATVKVNRTTKGGIATMVIETDNHIPLDAVDGMKAIDGMSSVRIVKG